MVRNSLVSTLVFIALMHVVGCVSFNEATEASENATLTPEATRDVPLADKMPPDLGIVAFLSESDWTGLAANGSVWITNDKGQTWTNTHTFAPTKDGRQMVFISKKIGYFLSDYDLWKTIDGGNSWERVKGLEAAIKENDSVDGLFFLDEQTGWIAGSSFSIDGGRKGFILKTDDGGSNWSRQFIRDEGRLEHEKGKRWDVRDIEFLNSEIGWAVGYGVILQTLNGGTEWTTLDAYPGIFEKIDVFDGGPIVISERLIEASLISLDAGRTWKPIRLPKALSGGSFMISKGNDGVFCDSDGKAMVFDPTANYSGSQKAARPGRDADEGQAHVSFLGRSFDGSITCLVQDAISHAIASRTSFDEGITWRAN